MTKLNWEKQARKEMPKQIKKRTPLQQKLDQALAQGADRERKRIIKLLDAEFDRVFPMKDYSASNAIMNVRAEVIKGENK
jgi:hypothetical protein